MSTVITTPADLSSALRQRKDDLGGSLEYLAALADISLHAVWCALHGKGSARMMLRVAGAMGATITVSFPTPEKDLNNA